MGLYVEIAYRGDWWGEDPITETRHETPGELFRALAGKDRRYPWEALGRCTGKVYVDLPQCALIGCNAAKSEHPTTGDRPHAWMKLTRHVGWIFVARNPDPVNRGDQQPTGLREAWVTVHEEPPTVVHEVTPHYARLDR